MSEQIRPERGSWWKHYKGGIYYVLDVARLEWEGETGEEMVVYEGMATAGTWIRPLREWSEMVGEQPRFALLKGARRNG